MKKTIFGRTNQGEAVYKYEITNEQGMRACVTDFGATILELWVMDHTGTFKDVVLGYDQVSSYEKETTYFGATVGPNANRIADAKLIIEGVEYLLDANDNGNSLHSGKNTMAKKVWKVKRYCENEIVFSLHNPHLEQGFPGNMDCEVSYKIDGENGLVISYYGISDRTTVFNMTNHAYFNLNGWDFGSIYDHSLWLKAEAYTPVKSDLIPTGEIISVDGTAFDFRRERAIGREQAYDHNFVLCHDGNGVEKVAESYGKDSGIVMEVWTDCPGLQFYGGNFLEGQIGKQGHLHHKGDGFCLETQYYPNAVNEPTFPSPLKKANEAYESKTIYKFGVR